MHLGPSTHLSPLNAASALRAEVEAAVALMGLAKIPSDRETLRRLHVNTKKSYERALELVPAGVRGMTHAEEDAVWDRLTPVQQWLESIAAWLRVSP
jgi:hypothetical protein